MSISRPNTLDSYLTKQIFISNVGNGLCLNSERTPAAPARKNALLFDPIPMPLQIYSAPGPEVSYQIFDEHGNVISRGPVEKPDEWRPVLRPWSEDVETSKWKIMLYDSNDSSKGFLIKARVRDYYLCSTPSTNALYPKLKPDINESPNFRWKFQLYEG